ncbi:class I SAM-dependent methyltransferase [Mycobacterium sp. NAZ190054]|uniref:class I SAM-dependent DNA methyltransferase n=1 Tax=Mycobacterium sp. NAZ190054 TaxID=1747766 RepID=UPI0007971055|nr:class I SAM-dependent methyltransferase [Mycobacterium sp. NAZ190054]KWX65535.1 methyltransferase type 11 [Mycobacterium sp. NAZ190054]
MTEAVVRHRYSEVADVYIRMFGEVDRVAAEDLAFLRRNLAECAGTVLDAGCGPGHLTSFLADLGLAAAGVDLVPEFVACARARRPDLDFAVGSLHNLALPDGALGGVMAWFSLIHCDTTELAHVLAEFHRMTVPGGMLVVGFFDGEAVERFDHKVTAAYRRPVDDMSRMLAAAGFAEVERVRRAGTDQARPYAAIAARAG